MHTHRKTSSDLLSTVYRTVRSVSANMTSAATQIPDMRTIFTYSYQVPAAYGRLGGDVQKSAIERM